MDRSTDILIVGGGPAGMSAAIAASSREDVSVTVIDDNPKLGGQIWRAELGQTKSATARKLIDAMDTGRITIINNASVFAAGEKILAAETPLGRSEIRYKKLIIATARRMADAGELMLGGSGADAE